MQQKNFFFLSVNLINRLVCRVWQSLELYTEFLTSVNNLRIVFRIKTCFLHHEVLAACLSAVFDCTSGFPLEATIFTFYSTIRKKHSLQPWLHQWQAAITLLRQRKQRIGHRWCQWRHPRLAHTCRRTLAWHNMHLHHG